MKSKKPSHGEDVELEELAQRVREGRALGASTVCEIACGILGTPIAQDGNNERQAGGRQG